jgi:hypothetical protein
MKSWHFDKKVSYFGKPVQRAESMECPVRGTAVPTHGEGLNPLSANAEQTDYAVRFS